MQAIDVHVHVPRQPGLSESSVESGLRTFFRMESTHADIETMVHTYKTLDILAVIFSVNTKTSTGDTPDSNAYVSDIVNSHPNQFIGFASVDPWQIESAVEELERAILDLGLKGLKLHPILQAFFPNDPIFHPLFQKCSDLKIPVIIHSGFAAAGAGLPGGGGFKLKFAAPIPCIDDLASEFPKLTIIMAHPAWPWIEQQIAVAIHKPNVFIDLSGWAPKYIPEPIIRETNTRLSDKILFGSDYPYLAPGRWLKEFEKLPIRDHVREKVLLQNARSALGI